ncbi:hypothetical protein BGW38_003563, partial [Lunasporangiospora selenospora]
MRCNLCSIEFATEQHHTIHDLENHSLKCVVTQYDGQKVTLMRTDGEFCCPQCQKPFCSKSGVRSHLARQGCKDEEPSSDPPRQAVTIPEASPATLMLPTPSTEPPRGHDEAVLFACQRQDASELDKIATLGIVHFLGLSPLTVKDSLGVEQNALAHPDGIKRLYIGALQSPVTVPNTNKRKLMADSVCQKCSPITIPSLESVFAFSPFCSVLRTRTFVELTESICCLLNEDWNFQPQHRYGCAQMLAGCLLVNTTNGHAVLANTVEVYGRTSMVDAHCEPFGLKKGVAIRTSHPRPSAAFYKDVWPSTMFSATEGERLVIGTQSFDALVTSSIRLDVRDQGSVGAVTGNFRLTSEAESTATRIYLDKESLDM